MKYLIINADDYNLTDNVSRGIIDACNKGIVTSTTIMVNTEGFEKNLKFLSEYPISVGIHFNLTYGTPLCNPGDIPNLVGEDGKFIRNFQIITDIEKQILLEIELQYNRFLEAGLKPSHFDSHHHIHARPELKNIFFDFALNKNLSMRSRGLAHKHECKEKNIRTADFFCEDFYGKNVTLAYLENILKNLKEGITEIMCHPGYSDNFLKKRSSYTDNREKELEILTEPKILKLIEELDIKLISYRELKSEK